MSSQLVGDDDRTPLASYIAQLKRLLANGTRRLRSKLLVEDFQ
jgi:hypothetical protein